MGTIAARDCLRVLQLTEQVAAAVLLAAVQGVKLRIQQNELDEQTLTGEIASMLSDVQSFFPMLIEDRQLENELRSVVEMIQQKRWSLYA